MRDKAAGHARIEYHRAAASRHFLRAEPTDRALAGAAADRGRVAQIVGEDGAGKIVVALHPGSRPTDRAGADAVARTGIEAGKAVRGGKGDARAAPSGLGPLGVGDTF